MIFSRDIRHFAGDISDLGVIYNFPSDWTHEHLRIQGKQPARVPLVLLEELVVGSFSFPRIWKENAPSFSLVLAVAIVASLSSPSSQCTYLARVANLPSNWSFSRVSPWKSSGKSWPFSTVAELRQPVSFDGAHTCDTFERKRFRQYDQRNVAPLIQLGVNKQV